MPTVITQGAASAKGYGFGARSVAANYIEDVFSTYLYTGTGASQTISNGVDLSTKGGMVWIKSRSAATNNFLFDTARGTTKEINSNTTDAEATLANSLTAFNTDGFTVNSATGIGVNAATYASWTFRKQAKFFDIVTYTGNGANRTIAHNLGSVPGCIIVKRTDTTSNWSVYHRSLTSAAYIIELNSTGAQSSAPTWWNSTAPTSSVFSLGTSTSVNANGGTYVAYLFAHDAGGFGAAGTDNVISCGSYTTDVSGNGTLQNLGYEPQWVMIKAATGTAENWVIDDSMRGMLANPAGSARALYPNTADAEVNTGLGVNISSTGFTGFGSASRTYIYIAIRRGPMKTPTSGTSVFSPVTYTGTGAALNLSSTFAPDMAWPKNRSAGSDSFAWTRLQGLNGLAMSDTAAEYALTNRLTSWNQTGITLATAQPNNSGDTYVAEFFRRAPGFFDVVCYTGTGANRTVSHNLGVAPELMIVKARTYSGYAVPWTVYTAALGNTKYIVLNTANGELTNSTIWNNTSPTASVFSVGTNDNVNRAADTYIAYLFATIAGVSKVGSYTGSGTTKQIDCGFTSGARFVLIKRTDSGSTGDWYVWDTARGIVAANDPYLLLNSTAAEVTNTDYIDTYSAGFEISSTAPAAINANGGSFIFLAIA